MKETSFAHILFAPSVLSEALRQAQSREFCRTAQPCLSRPDGVGGELQKALVIVET